MKKTIDTLKSFLEDAHKNGTDCQTAESKLALALHLLTLPQRKDDKIQLLRIVAELKEIHRLCLLPEEQTADDNSECGV